MDNSQHKEFLEKYNKIYANRIEKYKAEKIVLRNNVSEIALNLDMCPHDIIKIVKTIEDISGMIKVYEAKLGDNKKILKIYKTINMKADNGIVVYRNPQLIYFKKWKGYSAKNIKSLELWMEELNPEYPIEFWDIDENKKELKLFNDGPHPVLKGNYIVRLSEFDFISLNKDEFKTRFKIKKQYIDGRI